MVTSRRRLQLASGLFLGLIVVGAGAGAFVVRARVQSRAFRAELARAQDAMNAGRYGLACQRLSQLAGRWTNQGEVLLLLGTCELARGRRDEALAAWAKIPPASPSFARAALLRAVDLIHIGRYALAEEVLLAVLPHSGSTRLPDLPRVLSQLYRLQGRFDDVRRVLRGSWAGSPDRVGVLKELWMLDNSPMKLESWQLALAQADGSDDRVWLGRAHHAIQAGRFPVAADWLERCLKQRPHDVPVWRARLDLALATGDRPGFWKAIEHLPARQFSDADIAALRAWLAGRQGDHKTERKELAHLVRYKPGRTDALERLTTLAVEAGQLAEAQELRRRKVEVNRAADQCRKIMLDGAELSSRAELLARLSAASGRQFDAQGWAILAAAGPRTAGAGASEGQSSLPDDLAARAVALSAPFATVPADGSGPRLSDRFADLRNAGAAEPETTAASDLTPSTGTAAPVTPEFVDDAEAVGLRFVFDNGRTRQHHLPETMSGGVGLLDFDGDGWLDVYAIGGGPFPAGPFTGDHLFRNRRDGTFEDVTEKAGIAGMARGYGHGIAVGDYDNDGDADIFVTRWGSYALYRNRGDGRFEDATTAAGLGGDRDWPTSAAFADLDNDGDLDLYVCHYGVWDPANPRLCVNETGDYFYCDPRNLKPVPDHAFRNDGGRFVDVTATSGLAETDGLGLGVIAADLDDDNRIDLYVANDGTANHFFRNQGGFHFQEVGLEAGVAGNATGHYQAGMGVACGDLDGDGRPDLLVTNFYAEGTTLFRNLGRGLFADRSGVSGIGLASRYLLGFGIGLADVHNDGRPDVLVTNGHVNDNRPHYPYAMPCRLYENRPGGRLVDISDRAGAPWSVLRVGRGLAIGDLDNDGRCDALVLAQNEPLAYLHNRTGQAGHFVLLHLEGTSSNRDGVGARVIVSAAGRRRFAQRVGGGSYQSAHDPRLHFGLGDAPRADQVEVRWPSGRIDRWSDLRGDTGHVLREGDPQPRPLAGFRSLGTGRPHAVGRQARLPVSLRID